LKDKFANPEEDAGWIRYHNLFINPENSLANLTFLAGAELERRLKETRSFEEQKLAWGQGFFSYEYCDQQIYDTGDADKRNCRIITPGSLIKDHVSLVLGSAIRQIENADEYDERISLGALTALNNVLGFTGLRDTSSLPSGAINPQDITLPNPTPRFLDFLPTPFNTTTVDPDKPPNAGPQPFQPGQLPPNI